MEWHTQIEQQKLGGQLVIISEEGRIKYERRDLHFVIKAHDKTTEVSDQDGNIRIVDNTNVLLIGNRKIIDPVRGWFLLHHNQEEPREIIFRAMCPELLQQNSWERKIKQHQYTPLRDTPIAPSKPVRTCKRRLGYNSSTNPDREEQVAKPQDAQKNELQQKNILSQKVIETLSEHEQLVERLPREIQEHPNTGTT